MNPAHKLAMATDSQFVRTALKVVHWIAPPPCPHIVVPTVTEACAFIACHMPEVDPAELARKHGLLRAAALTRFPSD